MTSENFEEIFQLIKDDITKERTYTDQAITCSHNWPYIKSGIMQELCL